MTNDTISKINDESGQSFIEFILLFFILVTISFSVLSGFNRSIGGQWSAIVKAVSLPNTKNSFNL
jgi:hypothetical protein